MPVRRAPGPNREPAITRAQMPYSRPLLEQPPARTPTPTLTLGTAADAATPTLWPACSTSTGLPTGTYQAVGGVYRQASNAFPDNQALRLNPLPLSPAGYGRGQYDFCSDAPVISFRHQRAMGTMRVYCEGVELFRILKSQHNGTVTATGTTTTMTFAAGASAVAGFYVGQWVKITGGTNAGYAGIITGYTTGKVATVSPAMAAAPTTTSTYEVYETLATYSDQTNTGAGNYYIKADFNGERRLRTYRVEQDSEDFLGVYTGATDSVFPAPVPPGELCVWCGDSYSAGTGTDSGLMTSLARIACDKLGWQLRNVSIGSTGYTNSGTNSSTVFIDRLLPPINSWLIFLRGSTAGTYTLTQGGVTTGAIAYNATLATIQTALDTAFGAGNFYAAGDPTFGYYLYGRNATATVATAMTLNSSVTGLPINPITRNLGDVAPNVPVDGAGNPLPFNIVLAGGHNDASGTTLRTAVTTLINGLRAAFPTARIFVVGHMFLPGGLVGTPQTNIDTDLQVGTANSGYLVNGAVPFVSGTLTWFTGTGSRGALTGTGNSDLCTWSDAVHPTSWGHEVYGNRIAQSIQQILDV